MCKFQSQLPRPLGLKWKCSSCRCVRGCRQRAPSALTPPHTQPIPCRSPMPMPDFDPSRSRGSCCCALADKLPVSHPLVSNAMRCHAPRLTRRRPPFSHWAMVMCTLQNNWPRLGAQLALPGQLHLTALHTCFQCSAFGRLLFYFASLFFSYFSSVGKLPKCISGIRRAWLKWLFLPVTQKQNLILSSSAQFWGLAAAMAYNCIRSGVKSLRITVFQID